jgi:hypothetical protein
MNNLVAEKNCFFHDICFDFFTELPFLSLPLLNIQKKSKNCLVFAIEQDYYVIVNGWKLC